MKGGAWALLGLGVIGAGVAAYLLFFRKKAVAPRVAVPPVQLPYGQGQLVPAGWNSGTYLGPAETANDGKGIPALWPAQPSIPAPGGKSIPTGGMTKVWLPSITFGTGKPNSPVMGDKLINIFNKAYQDALRPSSPSGKGPRGPILLAPGQRTFAPTVQNSLRSITPVAPLAGKVSTVGHRRESELTSSTPADYKGSVVY